jgi:hypothetical protein
MGLVFHGFAAAVLRISFPSLWICYVALLEPAWFARIVRRVVATLKRLWRSRPPRHAPAPEEGVPSLDDADVWQRPTAMIPTAERRWTLPVVVMGSALSLGTAIQGARGQMASYPFACYPTFQWIAPSEMPDLVIELVAADGSAREVAHGRDRFGRRSQRKWGEIFRLARGAGAADRARLRAYFATLVPSFGGDEALAVFKAIRFWRVDRSVLPEDRSKPPTRRVLLWETPIAAGERAGPKSPASDSGSPAASTP